MVRHFFAMLLLVFVADFQTSSAYCQIKPDLQSGNPYQIKTWPPDDKSPGSVYNIAQSTDGYLWLANEFGLYRFDGLQFTHMEDQEHGPFKYKDCAALLLTSDSTLLAGFSNGLILAYKNQQWRLLASEEVFMNKNVTAISEDCDHNIWVGLSGSGIIRYNPKTSKIFSIAEGLCDNNINVICQGKNKEVWIGTDNGLCMIGHDEVKRYSQSEIISHLNINGLFFDSSGILWIGCANGQLFYLKDNIISLWNDPGTFRSCIKAITGYGKNTLAIGTEGQGVIILNTQTGKTEGINAKNSKLSNLVLSVFNDREGNLWAGTMASGFAMIRTLPVQIFNSANGLSIDCITSIIQPADGSIYLGNAEGGIDRIKDNVVGNFGLKAGLPKTPVFSLALDSKNNLWAGSMKTLAKFDGKSTLFFGEKQGMNCTYFHALYAAKDGSIWVGTEKGIFILKEDKISTVLTTDQGLPSNKIFCLLEDRQGTMWVGTQDGGLASVKDGKVKAYGKKQGLQDNMILCLHLDSLNNLWIGTGQDGLYHFDQQTGKFNSSIRKKFGATVGYIFEDRMGHIWLASETGFTVVNFGVLQKSMKDANNQLFYQSIDFDKTNGLAGLNMGLFPGACRLSNGQMWFPSSSGVAIINPENSLKSRLDPRPLIEAVYINNIHAKRLESYELEAGTMKLEIQYTAPAYYLPERISFRYRLKGFDKDWDTVGGRRTAYYTNVPPGDYVFEVQVFNSLGELSPGTASIRIHILPFFYQTWWFMILCLIAGLSVISLAINYRIKYLRGKELEALVTARTEEIRKLNEQLEQKVRDRTAQLEAANKELEAFSYSVSHDLKGPVRRIDSITRAYIEDYFSKLDETERDFLKKITDSAGSMNMLIDELLKLSRIVRHDIDKMQVNISDIAIEINQEIKKINPGRKVRLLIQEGLMEYCDPKLLKIVFQNLFDNAWKYSGKEKEAVIEFSRTTKDSRTVYLIRDNGVGFDMAYYDKLFTPFQRLHSEDQFTGTGIGLATVKRIILKHGGRIWAESVPGEGTSIYFTLDSHV